MMCSSIAFIIGKMLKYILPKIDPLEIFEVVYYYMASVSGRYNPRSDRLRAAKR